MPGLVDHEAPSRVQQRKPKKQRTTAEGLNIFPLPPIPSDCVDPHEAPPRGQPVMLRALVDIQRTESTIWGEKDFAAARASLESEVTDQNEQLIRTYHRSLGPCSGVYVAEEQSQKKIWVVAPGSSFTVQDTHAGGREIHLIPAGVSPPRHFGNLPYNVWPFQDDPLDAILNPRRFLSGADLNLLREMFPSAIGARVLISGFIVILFESLADIHKSWQKEGMLDSFGNLRICYDVIEDFPTKNELSSGSQISSKPESLEKAASLGLKLRFPHGLEAITVPTHAFVKVRQFQRRPLLRVMDLYAKIKLAMSRFRALNWEDKPSVGTMREPRTNSPLEKTVWLAGERRAVGTITFTYDSPSSTILPFPTGFRHDLSLVTSVSLPNITSPAGLPRIVRWGEYREVLDGSPIFVTSLNLHTGNPNARYGSAVSQRAQCALAEGSEYLWERSSASQSVSFLWRTVYDGDHLKGYSGSVLCLGQPQDRTCSAICFQNFETPLYSREFLREDGRAPPNDNIHSPTFKGGFLLPSEIRGAEILCGEAEVSVAPGTFPRQERSSTEVRRSFSSHR